MCHSTQRFRVAVQKTACQVGKVQARVVVKRNWRTVLTLLEMVNAS